MKRYITIKMEYEIENANRNFIFLTSNIKQIINEDMPHLKIITIKDTTNKDE